ncbi:glycosyltransferase [Foetidibacter luteolus]|uniref:glycosyltransferase n=1 Tax=Foetidibacter luteolus TaxID=2608880 RepID=UPI00129AC1B6|nr:glycosyltransferase [Foetidibacter luteolus]
MQDNEKAYQVSVIICCYNSAARLPETLQHLARQAVPEGFLWQLLIVNNASTDDTATAANHLWNTLKPANVLLSIINEPRPGQMHARKTGVQQALAECIVFCDDDNWLDKNYVYTAYHTLNQDARIGAAGGQNLPVTDAPEYPGWWEEYKDKYATGIPAAQSGDISHRGFILGAGMVTRRQLFLQLLDEKYPSLLNGRNGEKLSTGDDFEYSKRLLLRGYTLYYNQQLKLQHFIPQERLTLAYRNRLMEGIDEAGQMLKHYDDAWFVVRKHGHKNRLKLAVMAPLRILLAKLGISRRSVEEERLKLFYLTPFNSSGNPEKMRIKKFLQHK